MNDIDEVLRSIAVKERQGQLDTAHEEYQLLAEQFPSDPRPLNKLGVLAAKREKYTDAKNNFRMALAIDPQHVPALTNLANLELHEGRVETALLEYQRIIAIDPDYAPAYQNMAVAYRRLGNYTEMVKKMKQAQKLELKKDREDSKKMLKGKFGCLGPTAIILLLVSGTSISLMYGSWLHGL